MLALLYCTYFFVRKYKTLNITNFSIAKVVLEQDRCQERNNCISYL